MVEILVAIAVLGVVATLGVQMTGSASSSAKRSKLETDTLSLNRAVTMYIASGGDLSAASSPAEVLAKLKSTSTAARVKTQINPLTSALIDPRLDVVAQSDFEAASSEPRTYWNATDKVFEIKTVGGAGGVKRFRLNEDAVPAEVHVDSRSSGSMEFASQSGWIWDFNSNEDVIPGPTPIPTSVPLAVVSSPSPVLATPAPSPLSAPVFSRGGGQFPAVDFDLSVSLSNPNPSGSSHISYSMAGGPWTNYSGTLAVPAGSRVVARVVSEDGSRWYDSSTSQETYTAVLTPLDAPSIALSDNSFSMTSPTITVTLTDNNVSGRSDLYYSLKDPSGSYQPVQLWEPYTGSFTVSAVDYLDGFDIITYAKASDPNLYEHSEDTEAETFADFFGVPVTGDVLLVIDASSSMGASFGSGSRFSAVVQAVVQLIPTLRPNQRFNVAMFDTGVHWTDGTFELYNATNPFVPEIAAQIQTLGTGSGTSYEAALSLPMMYDPKPDTMIFLTDGEPNSDDYSSELNELVAAGIEVRVIGIELNSTAKSLVQSIANATGGTVTEISEP